MTLDDWIKQLELQRHNSIVSLTNEEVSEILKYLKELQKSKQVYINELQEEIRRLQQELDQPNIILPVPPVRENPLSSPNRYCPTLWYW